MATAKFVLKTIPNIDRPAIAKMMPSMTGDTLVLDLGANVDTSAEQLLQFAMMGSVFVKATHKKQNPSIGLLNVGSEAIKGNVITKDAYECLRSSSLNFYGNVEGDAFFHHQVDVIVCDGFCGNIALKSAEGLSKFFSATIKRELQKNWLSKLSSLCALPALNRVKHHLDPRKYNGATLLGLHGIVIKSHGGTDAVGFAFALEEARIQAEANLIEHLITEMSKHTEP